MLKGDLRLVHGINQPSTHKDAFETPDIFKSAMSPSNVAYFNHITEQSIDTLQQNIKNLSSGQLKRQFHIQRVTSPRSNPGFMNVGEGLRGSRTMLEKTKGGKGQIHDFMDDCRATNTENGAILRESVKRSSDI